MSGHCEQTPAFIHRLAGRGIYAKVKERELLIAGIGVTVHADELDRALIFHFCPCRIKDHLPLNRPHIGHCIIRENARIDLTGCDSTLPATVTKAFILLRAILTTDVGLVTIKAEQIEWIPRPSNASVTRCDDYRQFEAAEPDVAKERLRRLTQRIAPELQLSF